MKLEIVQAGDPVLRKKSRPLSKEEILSPSIQELIPLMRDTMREAPGVGLAAPQIGQSIQLAVIEDRANYIKDVSAEELAARQRSAIPFHVIINPKLTVVGNSSAGILRRLPQRGRLSGDRRARAGCSRRMFE